MPLGEFKLKDLPGRPPRIRCKGSDLNNLLPTLQWLVLARTSGRIPTPATGGQYEKLTPQNDIEAAVRKPRVSQRPAVLNVRSNEAYQRFVRGLN